MECHITGSRETHNTSRGEYATALNCTITKASEKTMPVNAIMPEVIEERSVNVTAALAEDVNSGRNPCSSLGRISPASSAIIAYHRGIAQSGSGARRFLVNMPIIFGGQLIRH